MSGMIDHEELRVSNDAMDDAVLVFIVPPNLAVLESRLRGRKTDSEQQILQRLAKARAEIAEAKSYDYWICNSVTTI